MTSRLTSKQHKPSLCLCANIKVRLLISASVCLRCCLPELYVSKIRQDITVRTLCNHSVYRTSFHTKNYFQHICFLHKQQAKQPPPFSQAGMILTVRRMTFQYRLLSTGSHALSLSVTPMWPVCCWCYLSLSHLPPPNSHFPIRISSFNHKAITHSTICGCHVSSAYHREKGRPPWRRTEKELSFAITSWDLLHRVHLNSIVLASHYMKRKSCGHGLDIFQHRSI